MSLTLIAEYAYEIAETAASEYLEVRPVGVVVRVEEGVCRAHSNYSGAMQVRSSRQSRITEDFGTASLG